MKVATAIEKSANVKIGTVSATYVTQSSCGDCVFKANGCYAEGGNVAFVTRRLNKAHDTEPMTPADIARQEAAAIDTLTGRLDLRVHVVGDCKDDESAQIVSAAMARHESKAGKASWTYTHSWREVSRDSWQIQAVQASCETPQDVRDANARGYAAAIVVDQHDSDKAYVRDGVTIVPCPEQTRGLTCVECRLCMGPAVQRRAERGNVAIGFAAHGVGRKAAIKAITN